MNTVTFICICRKQKEGTAFYLKMASASIKTNCTDRVPLIGGEVSKRQRHQGSPPAIEVVDIDDPNVQCHYTGQLLPVGDLLGSVGGMMSYSVPLVCGGSLVEQQNNQWCHSMTVSKTELQFPIIHSASIVLSQNRDTLLITGGIYVNNDGLAIKCKAKSCSLVIESIYL